MVKVTGAEMHGAEVTVRSSDYTKILQWLDRLSRWLLAAVFFAASVPKIFTPMSFAANIGAYGLLPEFMLLPAALVISVGEFVTAVGLLFARKKALLSTAVFMAVFIGVISYGLYLGLDIDCGCFGPEDPEHDAFSGLKTALVRDLCLLLPLLYSFWYSYLTPKK